MVGAGVMRIFGGLGGWREDDDLVGWRGEDGEGGGGMEMFLGECVGCREDAVGRGGGGIEACLEDEVWWRREDDIDLIGRSKES